jgi:hypothetical protein
LENSWWKILGIFEGMASWRDSTGFAPGARSITIAAIFIANSVASILIVFDWYWLWLWLSWLLSQFGALENSSWEALGILDGVASIGNGTSLAPGAWTHVVAGIFITESVASILIVFKLGHQEWLLSVADKFLFKMTSTEPLWWWWHLFTSVMWSKFVDSFHDLVDVVALMSSVEAHENNKDESEARFLTKSLSSLGSVSPCHHLSAFTNSSNFGKDEKEDRG